MEIEIFNKNFIQRRKIVTPCISVSAGGVFEINKQAGEALNLEHGNKISFVRDKQNPRDWYIYRDPNGITLRIYNTTGRLLFNSRFLRNLIYESIGSPELKTGRMRFAIATEPTQHNELIMYAILTSKLL